MSYGIVTTLAPAVEPVSLAEAKAHLRIDHSAEDTLITALIAAARRLTEEYCHQRWVTQEVVLTLPYFPANGAPIEIPVQPVQSVDSIAYTDDAGAAQTLTVATDVQTWLAHTPPLIYTAADDDWPDTDSDAVQAVTLELTVGYGDLAADVPEQVKAAMLLCLGDWDMNRAGEGTLPPAARFLLNQLWTGAYS